MDEKRAIAQKLLWVDMEMTGLEPEHDVIIEVAAIVTDWDLHEIATFTAGVNHPKDKVRALFAANDFFTNLPAATQAAYAATVANGEPAEEVERQLLAFIADHFGPQQPVTLAGNSIHQDRRFIRRYWPQLDARLHYRMLDVSAWKIVMQGRYGVQFAKQETHLALDDIRESIAELRAYLTHIQ